MQAYTDNGAGTRLDPSGGRMYRFFGRVADFFSPELRCDLCGQETQRRHYDKTGVTRNVSADDGFSRWGYVEIEQACPRCGGSVRVEEIPVYYSYV